MRSSRRNKMAFTFVSAVLLYFAFRFRKYDVRYESVITHVEPRQLWEFLSDFGNMKELNPTIESFTIESENGNYGHWTYRVHYTERLSQLPMVSNSATADLEAKILPRNTYVIHSRHDTCFLTRFICVHTESSFHIRAAEKSAETASIYSESITYECPVIFSSFCQQEVHIQRDKIKVNLKRVFENTVN